MRWGTRNSIRAYTYKGAVLLGRNGTDVPDCEGRSAGSAGTVTGTAGTVGNRYRPCYRPWQKGGLSWGYVLTGTVGTVILAKVLSYVRGLRCTNGRETGVCTHVL